MKKIWEKGGATTAPNAGNPAARAQSADGALGGSSMPSSEKVVTIGKKSRRMLKIFAAGGLAFFMGIGTLCGVLIAPMGATQASANSQAGQQAGQNASGAATAPKVVENPDGSIQIGLTEEETTAALMNGTWECDPETDPVIYTTDYGLDIKLHLSGYKSDPSTVGKLTSGKFSGYAYISAGGYNWAIVGRSSSITNKALTGQINIGNVLSTYSSFSGYASNSIWAYLNSGYKSTSTPAGAAVYNDRSKQYAYATAVTAIYSDPSTFLPNAKAITDTNVLAQDEVLCFAQGLLTISSGVTTTTFNASTSSGNRYSTSNLKSVVDTWYTNNLKSSWDSYIVSKTLKTTYSGGSAADSCTVKLFPLAGVSTSESFYYGTYMSTGSGGNMNVAAGWWLRSGYASNSIYAYNVYA
ncbi:MAG: hypothetical protein IKB21_01260, partial [Clostridia bacterium]|nr:hypothetical protein [Clostridia bacterium]